MKFIAMAAVVILLRSPSARKVWIEIRDEEMQVAVHDPSPSARKVWIEIAHGAFVHMDFAVTFRKEGVD